MISNVVSFTRHNTIWFISSAFVSSIQTTSWYLFVIISFVNCQETFSIITAPTSSICFKTVLLISSITVSLVRSDTVLPKISFALMSSTSSSIVSCWLLHTTFVTNSEDSFLFFSDVVLSRKSCDSLNFELSFNSGVDSPTEL